MMKWLRFASLCGVLAVVTGCGGSRELPPKEGSNEPKMAAKESAAKAMQGMPPEVRAKMESQYKKMKQ